MSNDKDTSATPIKGDVLPIPEKAGTLIPLGSCYYCNDPVGPKHAFCNPECRGSYNIDQLRRAQAQHS